MMTQNKQFLKYFLTKRTKQFSEACKSHTTVVSITVRNSLKESQSFSTCRNS